jgi:hemolysin activation/secretion protein
MKKITRMSSRHAGIVFLATFLARGGFAQVQPPDAGALQRELQLQLQRQAPAKPIEAPKSQEIKENNPNEQKVQVKGYVLSGNTLISSEQIQEVINKWSNTEVTFGDLKSVTVAIQDLYGKNGRIAQANVPPQNIQDGMIRIDILEAKMGEVILDQADPEKKLRVDQKNAQLYFSRNPDGSHFIDTRPLERSLVLLNELPGVHADGEFAPGKNPGESDYQVHLSDGPLFTGQAVLSNNGSYSTGVAQAIVNLYVNNITGVGDQATADLVQSWGSTYGQLGYSVPVGHDGWRVGVQGNYLWYQTLDSWNPTQSSGTSGTLALNTTYAWMRDHGDSANLRFNLDDRHYNNQTSGSQISDYQINSFSVGVNGTVAESAQVSLNYNLTALAGNLRINDPSQLNSDLSGPKTAGDFIKLSMNVSRTQNLEFLPNTLWLVSASGQVANKNLNSSEQLYLGGPYAVRAYPVAQGGGSEGIVVTTELQHNLDAHWQLGVFGDMGYIKQYVETYPNWQGLTNAQNTYSLYGAGLTARYVYDKLTVNAVLAFRLGDNPLYNSSGLQLNADGAYRAVQGWIRATYLF